MGNLISETAPYGGIPVAATYDQMNRVTAMQMPSSPMMIFDYTYGKIGNRLTASDRNGGSSYTYDSIYRMTEEAISRSEAKGTLSYGLDPVGNRQSLASTLTAISGQTASYNANDRVTGNSYDANGNTLGAGGKSYAYDSFDRMTSFNGGSVTMVYDGDGNRVKKISGGVTTQYLVDELNPTGLPQVMDEVVNGVVQRTYVYGLQRISQTQVASGTTSYYGYDAHGDVRFLADSTGKVTDTYDYDAFGNIVGSSGTTPNVYRYQGEALDAEMGLYYLRARYYDPVAGRFLSVDPMADQGEHPYSYAAADPVDGHDPTGQDVEDALILAAFMPPMPQISGIKSSVKCIGSLMLSVLSIPGQWMKAVTACQATPVRGGTGKSGTGHGPAAPPVTPPSNSPCYDSAAVAQTLDARAHRRSIHRCGEYVGRALAAGGAHVGSHDGGDYGPFLLGGGFGTESLTGYAPEQGDVAVFARSADHPYGHIAAYDGSQWVSDFFQGANPNPYRVQSSAGPEAIYRSEHPCH